MSKNKYAHIEPIYVFMSLWLSLALSLSPPPSQDYKWLPLRLNVQNGVAAPYVQIRIILSDVHSRYRFTLSLPKLFVLFRPWFHFVASEKHGIDHWNRKAKWLLGNWQRRCLILGRVQSPNVLGLPSWATGPRTHSSSSHAFYVRGFGYKHLNASVVIANQSGRCVCS